MVSAWEQSILPELEIMAFHGGWRKQESYFLSFSAFPMVPSSSRRSIWMGV